MGNTGAKKSGSASTPTSPVSPSRASTTSTTAQSASLSDLHVATDSNTKMEENRVVKKSKEAKAKKKKEKEEEGEEKKQVEDGEEVEEEEDGETSTFSDEDDDDEGGNDGTSKDTGIVPEAYTKAATERLLKELKELRQPNVTKDGYSVAPVEDNIYKWHVKLFGWDDDAQIKQDLTLYESLTQRDHVLLEVIFPKEYPNMPPFIRVVYPRFHQYTGHITIGGSICVKDLTRSGWSAEFQLQPFFVMIRNLLLEGGALVDMDNYATDYSEQEAREAFDRVARAHGWEP